MSLILDALNKAETERQKIETPPGLDSQHDSVALTPRGLSPQLKMVMALALALLIAIALAIYFYTQTPGGKSPAIAAPAAPEKPVPALAANNKQKHVAKGERKSAKPANKKPAASAAMPKNAPKIKSGSEVIALYEEQKLAVATTPATKLAAKPATKPAPAAAPTRPAVANKPKPTPRPTPATQRHPTLADFETVGSIRSLPWSLQEKIPTLNYEEHVYMPDNKGFIIINGKKLRGGGKIEQGLILDNIVTDGIILRFQNQVFKMPALNSWINI